MAELHSYYPSSPSGKRKQPSKSGRFIIQRRADEIKKGPQAMSPRPVAHRPLLLCPMLTGSCSSACVGRDLPLFSGRQELHYPLVTFPDVKQPRIFPVSTFARSPSRRFSHFFPEGLLLVLPSAAVAEEMFLRQGRLASAPTAPPAFVIVSLS